jgi:Holliday junction resolvase
VRANRIDSNQPSIVEALEKRGATVQRLNKIKDGCPDILVGYWGDNFLMEIKTADGTLTEDEREWIEKWNGNVFVVRTIEDALKAMEYRA